MNSVFVPSRTTPSLRRSSYTSNNAPPLPPRRNSVGVTPLQVKTAVKSLTTMDSRYYARPSSPRTRAGHPARSSTGTFAEPYYDPAYYQRAGGASSPRTSGERLTGSHHQTYAYAPTSSTALRTSTPKVDPYSGRRRRNTLETNDHIARPSSALQPITTSFPVRAPGLHTHHDRPSSPLARSWDTRGDTYITHGSQRREHKKVYSVDDSSHLTKLVAEKDIIEPRRRDGYSITSGGRSYHQNKPVRAAELGDEGYSYTNAKGMFDTTEPTWRAPPPRSGSVERRSRPTSMIMDRAPRTSDRALGPPPSTRGFDKINGGIGRTGSARDQHHVRSTSHERARDAVPKYDTTPKYDPYPEAPIVRSSSTRHQSPAVHQEPPRGRDAYQEYERRDSRDMENRRQNTVDRFEDRDVVNRGFGIAPLNPALAQDHHVLDRQPVWNAQDVGRGRPDEYGAQPYYPPPPPRPDVRIPEPRMPDPRMAGIPDPRLSDPRIPDQRVPDARASRDRDVAPTYDERPRDRSRDRRVTHADDRTSRIPSAVAGVAAGAAAATYGANEILKSRERERLRTEEADRDRERRKERDERERRDRPDDRRERDPEDRRERAPEDRRERAPEDRRDRDDRRDRGPEDRRDRAPEDGRDRGVEDRRERGPVEDLSGRAPEERERAAPQAALPAATASYALAEDAERKAKELRYEDEPREKERERERRPRKGHSSDDSSEERPRHYVDRDAAREAERRKESAPKEAELDPDEEYRRRIALEAERSSRAARDREPEEPDRDRERRRRRDDRDRSRSRDRDGSDDVRSRGGERSVQMLDANIVQEPDSLNSPTDERRDSGSRAVQIVTPPKDPQPAPRGILRKPTEKFPEHPEPIREGVAPHKSQLKGKDIPVDARWTKIDRRLVNPEALEAAKERFEERQDCVIVLRVLTKAEIQKLADRTKDIRQARGRLQLHPLPPPDNYIY
jgi:hypothetical protein